MIAPMTGPCGESAGRRSLDRLDEIAVRIAHDDRFRLAGGRLHDDGVAPLVMIGALTFFAAATMASMSRTTIFIIGAPGSAMSGCLFSWRSMLPNCVSSKLNAPLICVIATCRVAPGEFVST